MLFLFQYKCCTEMRFSRYSSQEFAGFTVLNSVCLQFSDFYTRKAWPNSRKGKSLNFSHYMTPIKLRSTGHQELSYM